MRALLLSLALLLTSAFAPAQAQQALPGLTEGVQYRAIEGGQPYQPLPPGMVEVAEVFAYTCPHCAHFSPMLEKWAKQLPAHARLVLVPGVFGRDDPWARMFFAAQTAKSLTVLHPRLFAAVHETGELPRNADAAQVTAFANRVQGVNAAALKAALADDATLLPKLKHAYEFAGRSQIEGTPSLIVGGRYLILGNSYDNLLANARAVVDALAPKKPAPGKPAPAKAKPAASRS
ncbi:thiol:disulfide interchange protein DsbA/DsbL [Thermomonas brevis]|uniref:Thiol:disulfide interchange protein DsbA/DsbL n=1 Tax=Thermomonas brevis TaxID=215691 RepID=A0A7G9QQY6_9GAMM|nr:thiol:disulfide interchange protein DsbA/DsbL [Thermomonas brevis]QNN45761.1 thiol:disulfide interchange protein DsbA/DsbL [Thermomonas brevis]